MNVLILNFIKDRISSFGDLPICNLVKERGFFIGEFCFPLCVRCGAIVFSILLSTIFIRLLKIKQNKKFSCFFAICLLPCLFDGVFQYCFGIESNNLRRFTTGILCGIGIGYISNFIYEFFSKKHFFKQFKK